MNTLDHFDIKIHVKYASGADTPQNIKKWISDALGTNGNEPYIYAEKGYDLTYKMLDEDFSREELFETFPGARTFPQIIVDGEKIGGFTDFKALVDSLD